MVTPLAYTTAEVADALQVSPDTVQRLVRKGLLRPVPHLGGKIRIPVAELERFMADTERAS